MMKNPELTKNGGKVEDADDGEGDGAVDAAKLPWKKIAAYVAERGGYGFSFAGCRKKWDEICEMGEKGTGNGLGDELE